MAGTEYASRPLTRSLANADAARTSRRAFGDVSNQAKASTAKNINRTHKDRRSRRLSGGETSSNPAEEDTTTNEAPRRSRRLSGASATADIQQDELQSEPATNQVSKKSRATKKSRKSRMPSRTELDIGEPPRKMRRRKSASHKKSSGKDPSICTNPCSDILINTGHGLQRHPFDDRQYTHGVAEHDKENTNDPQEVSNYVTDIFQRLFDSESKTKPQPYMDSQPGLNITMRSILVDWLVEVHTRFRLLPETLYLCVNILDRYLSQEMVPRGQLQLVGVTALLLACKYEEIYPPEVRDCVYITDRAYNREDVLEMEAHIVMTLQFRMTVPTGYPFLKRFLEIVNASRITKNLANFYMERMLQEYGALNHRPSIVAATAVSLAISNPDVLELDVEGLQAPGVPEILLRYTGFTLNDIREVAVLMEKKIPVVETTPARRVLNSVKRKYESDRYDNVSTDFSPPKVSHLAIA